MWLHGDLPQLVHCSGISWIYSCTMQAPVPRLNRAIAEEQLGVEAAARGDIGAAESLYAAAVEVRNAGQERQRWEASGTNHQHLHVTLCVGWMV